MIHKTVVHRPLQLWLLQGAFQFREKGGGVSLGISGGHQGCKGVRFAKVTGCNQWLLWLGDPWIPSAELIDP